MRCPIDAFMVFSMVRAQWPQLMSETLSFNIADILGCWWEALMGLPIVGRSRVPGTVTSTSCNDVRCVQKSLDLPIAGTFIC